MKNIFIVIFYFCFSIHLFSLTWETQNTISDSTDTKQGLKVVGNDRGDTVAIWMQTSGATGIYVAYSPPTSTSWTLQQVSTYTSLYNPSICINNQGQGFIAYANKDTSINQFCSTLYIQNFTISNNSIVFENSQIANDYLIASPSNTTGNVASPLVQISSSGYRQLSTIDKTGLYFYGSEFSSAQLNNSVQISAYIYVEPTTNAANTFTRYNSAQSLNNYSAYIWNGGSGGYSVRAKTGFEGNFSNPILISNSTSSYGISGGAFIDIDNNQNTVALINNTCDGQTPTSTASGWQLYFGDFTSFRSVPSLSITNATNSFYNPPALEINSYGFGAGIYSTADDQLNSFAVKTDAAFVGQIIPFAYGTHPAVSTDDVQNIYAAWIDKNTGQLSGGRFSEDKNTWDSIQIISSSTVNTSPGTANFANLSIAATKTGYGVATFIGTDNKVYSVFFTDPLAPITPWGFIKANELFNPAHFQKGL